MERHIQVNGDLPLPLTLPLDAPFDARCGYTLTLRVTLCTLESLDRNESVLDIVEVTLECSTHFATTNFQFEHVCGGVQVEKVGIFLCAGSCTVRSLSSG